MRPRGERKIVVMADGGFDLNEAKTAVGVMRYGRDRVLAVVDRTQAGKMASEVVGVGTDVPIVGSVREALAAGEGANTLLLGTAPRGGVLPDSWRAQIVEAMRAGLDVINGLHAFLSEDPELGAAAREAGVEIWDVRRAPETHSVADTRAHRLPATVVLAVGSDCNVGKMSTMLEIDTAARARGRRASFVPTGQTGILIAGWGVALDEVISDFAAGAAEDLVMEAAKEASSAGDLILVEGQGSLVHPGYSGVTLSLMHGSAPDAMILCHQAGRTAIRRYTLPIPPLKELVQLYEYITQPVKPAKVIGVALNTFGMAEDDARAAVERATQETGLPATDPVRYGVEALLDAIERFSTTMPTKGGA
ncbi:MAG: Protein often near L-alanine-DL-glutamate epimerase (cell wall recycling) [uncultured Chloroflexi bacterium]|uniref:Protein often near L-alanine-DL-glutamate epimerase (Cell wall recycling) n=1 Tax=uncultured Chloroflexota bacterium TaxID=166587 RepID=A0A6J4J5W6_9CHLR|nr:MAG: Protein often near L-alanine-DL-glutamate epimerase (cell wall recycling) [uncultured Chloroflexota bacterium]